MIPTRQLFGLALFIAAALVAGSMLTCAATLQSPNCANFPVVAQHYWRGWQAEEDRRERR